MTEKERRSVTESEKVAINWLGEADGAELAINDLLRAIEKSRKAKLAKQENSNTRTSVAVKLATAEVEAKKQTIHNFLSGWMIKNYPDYTNYATTALVLDQAITIKAKRD